MSLQNPHTNKLMSAQFDINSAADKHTFGIMRKCRVVRAAVICNSADTGGATIKFDLTAAGAAAAARGDGDIASITLPASDLEGDCYFDDVAANTVLHPGARVTVQVTAEGVSANAYAIAVLEVEDLPEEDDNESYLVETA